jgi:hypothetical protein
MSAECRPKHYKARSKQRRIFGYPAGKGSTERDRFLRNSAALA